MSYSRDETTTLSSIKSRVESGKIDKVKLAFYDGEIDSDDPFFVDVDSENIPNSPQTVIADVDYNYSNWNYAIIKARTLFGLDMMESYYG